MTKNKKRRTINDWKNAAIGAAREFSLSGRSSMTERELRKLLRDNISGAFERRPNSAEVDRLWKLMESVGSIRKLPKNPIRIGEWSGTTEVVSYEIIPEKVKEVGNVTTTSTEEKEVEQSKPTPKKELKFRMSIQKGGLKKGALWHNGVVLKSFKDFSVIQFVLNQETQDDSTKFMEAMEELQDEKVSYSFDLSTNPGVVQVVEKLMAL